MTEPAAAEIRDFTLPMKPKRFKIDDDVFQAPAILSPIVLKNIASMYASLGDLVGQANDPASIERMLNAIADVFRLLLPGESGARFVKRLNSTGAAEDEPPIDLMRQAVPIFYWLIEQYGMRPTQQSSPLLSDSGTGDLTDGALTPELTGEPSATPLNS